MKNISSITNPVGYGMAFCLQAMEDCKQESDHIMYARWLELGVKYAKRWLLKSNSPFSMNTELAYKFGISVLSNTLIA